MATGTAPRRRSTSAALRGEAPGLAVRAAREALICAGRWGLGVSPRASREPNEQRSGPAPSAGYQPSGGWRRGRCGLAPGCRPAPVRSSLRGARGCGWAPGGRWPAGAGRWARCGGWQPGSPRVAVGARSRGGRPGRGPLARPARGRCLAVGRAGSLLGAGRFPVAGRGRCPAGRRAGSLPRGGPVPCRGVGPVRLPRGRARFAAVGPGPVPVAGWARSRALGGVVDERCHRPRNRRGGGNPGARAVSGGAGRPAGAGTGR